MPAATPEPQEPGPAVAPDAPEPEADTEEVAEAEAEPETEEAAKGYVAEPDPAPSVPDVRGTVSITGLRVRGRHSRDGVQAALGTTQAAVETCYREALERKKNLKGRMTFSLSVRKHGRPAALRYRGGSFKDGGTRLCALKALRTTRFPKSKTGTSRVRLTMLLEP